MDSNDVTKKNAKEFDNLKTKQEVKEREKRHTHTQNVRLDPNAKAEPVYFIL